MALTPAALGALSSSLTSVRSELETQTLSPFRVWEGWRKRTAKAQSVDRLHMEGLCCSGSSRSHQSSPEQKTRVRAHPAAPQLLSVLITRARARPVLLRLAHLAQGAISESACRQHHGGIWQNERQSTSLRLQGSLGFFAGHVPYAPGTPEARYIYSRDARLPKGAAGPQGPPPVTHHTRTEPLPASKCSTAGLSSPEPPTSGNGLCA